MTQSADAVDNFIYEEMMVHPLFFTHPNLQTIALLAADGDNGLLREILKHQSIRTIWQEQPSASVSDPRLRLLTEPLATWLAQTPAASLDGIIIGDASNAKDFTAEHYQQFIQLLNADGIFIQQAHSWFNPQALRGVYQTLQQVGFQDLQILNFPQPHLPQGSRVAIMAAKNGTFKKIREKDIFNKNFATKFYNFDMHRAALALPEFVRHELAI